VRSWLFRLMVKECQCEAILRSARSKETRLAEVSGEKTTKEFSGKSNELPMPGPSPHSQADGLCRGHLYDQALDMHTR